MQTSNDHILLFTKEGCPPCIKTKDLLNDLISLYPHLMEVVSVMRKEQHSTLVETYNLSLYPTMLVIGPDGMVLDEVVGGKDIRDILKEKLIFTYRENNA